MSSYTPAVPSANGGTNAVSQDTFAAVGAAVSGSGGGGGGSTNPVFNNVTIAQNGNIYFSTVTTPTYGGGLPGITADQYLTNAITEQSGEAVACTTSVASSFGTNLNPFAAGMFTVATYISNTNQVSATMGNRTGAPGNIDIVTYDNVNHLGGAGLINLVGFTTISSLSVSSINGQVPGTGGGPAVPNAQFSSITMPLNTGYISTSYVTSSGLTASTMNISSINGVNFAALVSTVNGLSGGGGGGTAPSVPSAPTISGSPGQTSMTLNYDSTGETGTEPITYSGLYGTSAPPTNPASMINVGGNNYVMALTGLIPDTAYYAQAVATNAYGTVASLVAGPFTTAA